MPAFAPVAVNDESFIRGAGRLMVAGTTISFPSEIGQIVNLSTYAPQSGWTDLGATKTGIQISVNNTEETFDVDQVSGDLYVLPNSWECSVAKQLAELSLERLAVAWEGSTPTTNSSTTSGVAEKQMGFGNPLFYIERKMAVLFQRPNGKIRAYVFRRVQRSAQESTINYAKEGEQQTIPVRFKALADASVNDVYKRFFMVYDQQ